MFGATQNFPQKKKEKETDCTLNLLSTWMCKIISSRAAAVTNLRRSMWVNWAHQIDFGLKIRLKSAVPSPSSWVHTNHLDHQLGGLLSFPICPSDNSMIRTSATHHHLRHRDAVGSSYTTKFALVARVSDKCEFQLFQSCVDRNSYWFIYFISSLVTWRSRLRTRFATKRLRSKLQNVVYYVESSLYWQGFAAASKSSRTLGTQGRKLNCIGIHGT